MQAIRSALLSIAAVFASALPAAAQAQATGATVDNNGAGGSLVYVWGWILVAGIIIFIVGTSLGVRSGRK